MKSKLLSKRVLVLFILLLGFSPLSQAFAQFGITGTVTDWARNPIIGATVVIQGTNIGTTTDFDGHYTIYAIPGDTLIFSYLGMKTLKVGVRSFGSVTHTSVQHNANSDLSLILVHTTFAVSERLEYTGISPNTIPPSKRYW